MSPRSLCRILLSYICNRYRNYKAQFLKDEADIFNRNDRHKPSLNTAFQLFWEKGAEACKKSADRKNLAADLFM